MGACGREQKVSGVPAADADWQTGGERDPPPEQEATAGTTEKTEEVQNNVDISGQAAGYPP